MRLNVALDFLLNVHIAQMKAFNLFNKGTKEPDRTKMLIILPKMRSL